jgi:murein DD-endopeptidase MepM/ murein hydrolase activator NlpD
MPKGVSMKIKWRKQKLTFVIIPEANRSIRRIRIPLPIVYFIPLAALALLSTLLILYIVHMHTVDFNSKLQMELAEDESIYKQTIASKDDTINGLQNDVISLSNQADQIKVKVEELKQLEIEILGITEPIAAKENPVSIASFETAEETANNDQASTGGALVDVHNDDISKLALDTASGFSNLESEMSQLMSSLSEAKDEIIEYQALMKITPSIWPTKSLKVTSTFGYRKDPFTRRPSLHTGIDIGGNYNDPVYATADGTVQFVGYDNAHGHNLIINHSNGLRTRYMHLNKKPSVNQGETVEKGQQIGLLGSTGRSTGPHLHYEIIKNGTQIDPKPYMQTARKGEN